MDFKEYLKIELKKPVHQYYDKNGNSARAVVVRGLTGEVIYQFKDYPRRLKYEISCFDELNTPLGWFIQLPIMIVFAPILPIIAGHHWHKKSLKEFMIEYAESVKD